MHVTSDHSRFLAVVRVRLASLVGAPLTCRGLPNSYVERRASSSVPPPSPLQSRKTVRLATTTAGASLKKLQRYEEALHQYRPGGYHPVHLGDVFNDRYEVLRKIGYGRYSTVWLARDTRLNRHVALKILTADSYGREKDIYELSILRHIKTADPRHPGYKHVICLVDDFRNAGPHGEHVCLVFGLMGENMAALGRRYPGKKLPVDQVKQVARQLLLGLDYLHHSCNVVHTDVQPRNMMIQVEDVEAAVRAHLGRPPHELSDADETRKSETFYFSSEALATELTRSASDMNITLADFGVASWVDNHLTELIQPPSLRAPEVLLGADWSTGADIWSAACVIFELLQGRVLFRGRPDPKGSWTAEDDHLAQMIELFGPLPSNLLEEGRSSESFFDQDGNLLHIHQIYPSSLERVINFRRNPSLSDDDVPRLVSFLRSMLQYRPGDRASAGEAATDPWLQSN